MSRRARPPEVERQLRREAGYGCCKCGLPIYDYHHIVPYHEDDPYPVEEMMLLCPLHHRETLGGALTEEEQWALKRNPRNMEWGLVDGTLKVNQAYCAVAVGQSLFVGEMAFVIVDGEALLTLRPDACGRLGLSLSVYDPEGRPIALIEDNEWISGDPFPWDIESNFQYLRMRDGLRDISLEIDARREPVKLRAELWANGHRVSLSPTGITVDGGELGGASIRNLGLVGLGIVLDTSGPTLSLQPSPSVGQGAFVSQETLIQRLVASVDAWNRLTGRGHLPTR